MHDETKLPKWAQERLSYLRKELKRLREIHRILADENRGWLTIKGPQPNTGQHTITLWVLYPDKPQAVCSLGSGDLLFIGRAAKPQPSESVDRCPCGALAVEQGWCADCAEYAGEGAAADL